MKSRKLLLAIVSILCVALMFGSVAFAGEAAETSDLEAIMEKGTLVVGITDFEPMDYKDANGNWIGFDADMAKGFAKELGVEVEFIEIDWDNKLLELKNKSIDCIWNGMTLTDEVKNSTQTSKAYCDNAQTVVTSKENMDLYKDVESLKQANIAVEAGSAAADVLDELGSWLKHYRSIYTGRCSHGSCSWHI